MVLKFIVLKTRENEKEAACDTKIASIQAALVRGPCTAQRRLAAVSSIRTQAENMVKKAERSQSPNEMHRKPEELY